MSRRLLERRKCLERDRTRAAFSIDGEDGGDVLDGRDRQVGGHQPAHEPLHRGRAAGAERDGEHQGQRPHRRPHQASRRIANVAQKVGRHPAVTQQRRCHQAPPELRRAALRSRAAMTTRGTARPQAVRSEPCLVPRARDNQIDRLDTQRPIHILNHMVQYSPRLDHTFAALSDPTRRGVLEHLGRRDASISELAAKFEITLTGMKKHVQILERSGLVASQKVGRVRTCSLGPQAARGRSRLDRTLPADVERASRSPRGVSRTARKGKS